MPKLYAMPSAAARWLAALALLTPYAGAQPTQPLNDTGQAQCHDGAALAACAIANTGSAAAYPGQDGRFGRDAAYVHGAPVPKTGGGAAGFDFSALDAGGNATAPGGHDCVRDNATGLTWEVKQNGGTSQLRYEGHLYTWYDSSASHPGSQSSQTGLACHGTLPGNLCNTQAYVNAVNAAGLCGKTNWRLPTRRELLSIVHYGAHDPAIDTAYFPSTAPYWWTSDSYAPDPLHAWSVNFTTGNSSAGEKTDVFSIRLVRSGP